jgi:hypothetical protein
MKKSGQRSLSCPRFGAGGLSFAPPAYMLGLGFTGLARRKDRSMPRKGITGHDEWVITQALATALVALEQLPANIQPKPHMEDLRKLLTAGCQPGTMNLHLAQAKCRLFPDKDSLAVYQEYGVEGGRD